MVKICLSTPFANKQYCLKEYQECIEDIISDMRFDAELFYVLYDNGNCPEFSAELERWAKTLYIPFTHHIDPIQHFTIENTTDYGKVSSRVVEVYQMLFEHLIPEDTDYVFNIEDDTTFPQDTLRKLVRILEDNPDYITASGVNYNRRMGNLPDAQPMLWNFEQDENALTEHDKFMGKISRKITAEKKEGLEVIGASGVGCWLTRYPVLKEMGWKIVHPKIGGGDLNWGYRIQGHFVVDHSIKTKHWWLMDGEKGFHSTGDVGRHKPLTVNGMIKRGSPGFGWKDGVWKQTHC